MAVVTQDLLENCSDCYQFELSELPATIVIKGNLAPSTNYILKATDKFNNKFSAAAQMTDGSGNLTVTLGASFPVNFFNRSAGIFQFELSQTAQPWTPATLTFTDFTTTCILVQFVNDDGNINTIQ